MHYGQWRRHPLGSLAATPDVGPPLSNPPVLGAQWVLVREGILDVSHR